MSKSLHHAILLNTAEFASTGNGFSIKLVLVAPPRSTLLDFFGIKRATVVGTAFASEMIHKDDYHYNNSAVSFRPMVGPASRPTDDAADPPATALERNPAMSNVRSSELDEIAAPPSHRATRVVDSFELSLNDIARALAGLRFGEVRIVVQDSVIVQLDRTEKKRLR
jgi:hypothetical protein